MFKQLRQKGLGQIGGINGDASVVLPSLAKLQLYDLDKKLQAIRDPDNVTLKKLKEAVFWAIKQCDTWDQYS
jgi:hypothetical protein